MVAFMQDWKQIQATGWTQQSKNTAPGDSLRSNRPTINYFFSTFGVRGWGPGKERGHL